MSAQTIDRRPVAAAALERDLARLGVEPGTTLMVHSSLSSIGWVVGGPQTVVRALLAALGDDGTLVMPAASPQCSDPADWADPAVPEAWLDEVREHLPVFDPRVTPTTLGAIPEAFRTWPGTLRSHHPLESVCARGPRAAEITKEHSLAFCEGRGTPFEKLHDLGARILLLGVGFNRCTALHYAESRVEKRRTRTHRFPWTQDGRRVWIEVPDMADDGDTHFPIVGEEFVAAGGAREGRIGEAPSTLFEVRDVVDFAVRYFERVL